jgi:putative nucleotidyltransferase with HDIG domain
MIRAGTEQLERSPATVIERALEAARDMLGMDVVYARGLPSAGRSRIGPYVGVPVVTSQGEHGSLCALGVNADQPLGERELAFLGVLAQLVGDQLEREREHQVRVSLAFRDALIAALEARDGYTGEHSQAVVDLALAAGERMGLGPADLEEIETVALLHDVGKLGIPDAVLRKPGPLDAAEWAEMRRHVIAGAEIVEAMPALAHLAPAIRASHERWDGTGYPDGLAAAEIPIAARIVFVCDAYHAMVSDRPYRSALGVDLARAELERCAGSQFCPDSVAAVLETLRA